jgi:hypothetical protein
MDINKINNILFKLIIHNIKQYSSIEKKKIDNKNYYYDIKLNNNISNNYNKYIIKKKNHLLYSFHNDNKFIKLLNNCEIHIYRFDINISFINFCTEIILYDELYGYNEGYTSIFSDIINIKNNICIYDQISIFKLFFKEIDKLIIPNYIDKIDLVILLKWNEYFKSICFKTKNSYYLIEMLI